ncbi:uncharacterized protein [Haliotis asinina]|uniref:uncharacterized protein n=1 Tax=Haliotis asinina TaxID=109174 RepID=UPI003531842D
MMETERRLMGDEAVYTDIPYTTTELSPYSTTSTYSSDTSHNSSFYNEFDCYQNSDPNRIFYPVHERSDIAMHNLYAGFTPSTATDVYQPNAVWHHQQQQDVSGPSQMTPVTSVLPSMTFCRTPSQTSPTGLGPNGKPKRKRIQTMPQRKAANVRERKRMFHLNEAFDSLRLRLPAFNYEKRLSRIETLRLAITYIGFMKEIMDGKDPKDIKLEKDFDMSDMENFQIPSVSASSSKEGETDSE